MLQSSYYLSLNHLILYTRSHTVSFHIPHYVFHVVTEGRRTKVRQEQKTKSYQ